MGKLDQPFTQPRKNDAQSRHLILTRKLGHKLDIPGGAIWQAFRNSANQCYVCDRKIYTMFLWSPTTGIIDCEKLNFNHEQKQILADYMLKDR